MAPSGGPHLTVLLVTRRFTWAEAGGGEIDARQLAEWLAAQGHRVHVLAVDARGEAPSGPNAPKVHTAGSLSIGEIRSAIREVRPDVVHSYNMEGSTEAILAARTLGVPSVVTANSAWATCLFGDMYRPGHGICTTCSVGGVKDCFEKRPAASIERRVPAILGYAEVRRRRFLLDRADRIIALSTASEDLLARNGIGKEKVRIVPTWTKVSTRAPDEVQRERKLLLYAGALTFSKGTDLVVRAFARIARKHPDARLVLVGHGPHRSELERIAIEEGVRDRVEFAGYVPHDELAEWYRRAAVFVFPLRSEEAFAKVILESWSAGLPIVATRVSAPGRIIGHEVDGLLARSEDVDSIASEIERVLTDEELAQRLVAGGRKRLPEYDIDAVLPKVVEVYREAIAARAPDRRAARSPARS